MSMDDLPAVNACLNGLSAIFLSAGYICIRRGDRDTHRNCMILAFDCPTTNEFVIWPKVGLVRLREDATGSPFNNEFVTLKASARNSNCWPSRGRKIRERPKSNFQYPGPVRLAARMLPIVPIAGSAKALGFR